MTAPRIYRLLLLAITCLAVHACSSIPVEQRADRRAQLSREADETVALMIEKHPEVREQLEDAAGYFVSRVSAANVAVLGGGQGIGVLVDQQNGARSFLNVRRFDLGPGLGVRYFRVLLIVETAEKLAEFRSGITFRVAGADIAAGKAGAASVAAKAEGLSLHILGDTGGSFTATARMIRLSVNNDLTDTGVSEIGIPNIGFDIEDGREETERRWWDHKMPFMAQKVIDMGYDLPLPYGVRASYAYVDQDQLLDNLYVGFNGSDLVFIDFADFENAKSKNDTFQVIYDTWVLPFMNVFAILGRIDGNAPVDVLIDGNGFLDALGIDCSRPGNLVACGILEDREFTLPLDVPFEGNSYGIGINLAGGWRSYFVTIPMTYVYADMDGSKTDGAVFTASPRVGKVFNLGNRGNLALYMGGSYLKSDLTVSGTVTVPGTDLQIDYLMDQSNKDRWNGVLGLNWDISSRWALQAEYNGFFGSREMWMGSLTWRF